MIRSDNPNPGDRMSCPNGHQYPLAEENGWLVCPRCRTRIAKAGGK